VATEREPPVFRLVGVILAPHQSTALLRRPSGSATVRAMRGDIVDGWEVATIAADRITLRRGGQQTVVQMLKRHR
jgi:hypothetical protein